MEVKRRNNGSKVTFTITGELDEFLRIIDGDSLQKLLRGKTEQRRAAVSEQEIRKTLKKLGILPNIKGFRYITEAKPTNKEFIYVLTKEF